MKPLCIYHGGCDDGFGAAWAVRRGLGDNVEFYPGVHGKEPPPHDGRDVILVDFSYPLAVLNKMVLKTRTILILDHHKTAEVDLTFVPPPLSGPYNPLYGMHALFDMNRSGAAMAWDYFVGGQRPELIEYIQDRDLWRKKLPGTDEFTIGLRSYPQTFEVWDTLVERGAVALIEEGTSIQRYYRLRVEEFKRDSYKAELGGHVCWISNTPSFAASEVAGEISRWDGAEFGACYVEEAPERYKYSLRSRDDYDVSAIAQKFGGGGHKNAAGFVSPILVHNAMR